MIDKMVGIINPLVYRTPDGIRMIGCFTRDKWNSDNSFHLRELKKLMLGLYGTDEFDKIIPPNGLWVDAQGNPVDIEK